MRVPCPATVLAPASPLYCQHPYFPAPALTGTSLHADLFPVCVSLWCCKLGFISQRCLQTQLPLQAQSCSRAAQAAPCTQDKNYWGSPSTEMF